MTALLRRSAVELAELIRERELSARELVQASLDAIAERDGRVNAFTHVAPEAALAEADRIDATLSAADADERPFAGVPIAIKDNRAVAGMPLTMCSDIFGGFVARQDAYSARRLREAGFVIVGKTALPELGILPTTESRRNGPTANPWDLTRTPGGSSGGAGAAVAAGMVPVAHGNDGGGSIRIPAACCGLVGLKPSRGRVSSGPDAGHSFLAIDGVLTRDVRDTAAVLDVLAGYEAGDASWAPPPAAPFARALERGSWAGPLRVALMLEPALDGAVVDPVCLQAARDAAQVLSGLGHEVSEVPAPWTNLGMLPTFTSAFGPLSATGVAFGARLAGREPTEDDVEPLTWEMYQLARTQSTLAYLEAQTTLEVVARRLVSFMLEYDVVLTPALGMRPVKTGEIHGRGPDPLDHFRRSGDFTPYTAIVNVTGQPAIAVPLFHGDDDLPLAVHLIGPPAGEDVLIGLAAQLERAHPWSDRTPEAFASS
ncbi:MAG TPA: amidase [Solirubrobacteraceae bacterium]|nr:amidase [Solirubrobacteraceae bacterium]